MKYVEAFRIDGRTTLGEVVEKLLETHRRRLGCEADTLLLNPGSQFWGATEGCGMEVEGVRWILPGSVGAARLEEELTADERR